MKATDLKVLERTLVRERARREELERLLAEKNGHHHHYYDALEKTESKLRAALEQIKSQQTQLVQSEKLASLGTMAAGVAHEINNPLSFVLSNVNSLSHSLDTFFQYHELVREVIATSSTDKKSASARSDSLASLHAFVTESDLEFLVDDCGELIRETKNGINRVKQIVAGLQHFARSDSGELEDVDIIECLQNTLKLAHNQIKYNLQVIEDFEDIPLIRGYAGKLSQVFLNLIVNASQAMNTPGKLIITTRCDTDSVKLSFQDDGCGMSQQTMENIFNPFYTTKPAGKGTGLGLSISYGIVEEHKGCITVTSVPDKGTCFSIVLPVRAELQHAA